MEKKRIVKWDNIKFFMILSVVVGHTLYEFMGSSDFGKGIYFFIYTYHMPVFIFVAGLFSKSAVWGRKYERVLEYAIIYLVMKFFDSFGNVIMGYKDTRFHLFWEDGPGWFAFAMAAFILITIFLQDLDPKYVMTAAILLGCFAGLDSHLGSFEYGNHFVAMRILVFYPIFLAGYYLDTRQAALQDIEPGIKIILKILSFVLFNLILLVSIFKINSLYRYINFLKAKDSYQQIVKGIVDGVRIHMGLEGVAFRFLCYVIWAILIAAIILFHSEKEWFYTWVGTRTMSIFIWHKLVITVFLRRTGIIKMMKHEMPHTYILGAICLGVIICILTAYLPAIRIPKRKSTKVLNK